MGLKMSNEIIVTCSVASERKMYGKRTGQTQIKFKFESEDEEFMNFIASDTNPISTKPFYLDERNSYERLMSRMNKFCDSLTEWYEHKNWKFVFKVPSLEV